MTVAERAASARPLYRSHHGVESFRIEVRTVGPHQCAQLRIHADAVELNRVSERLEHLTSQLGSQVDVTDNPVAEREPEPVLTEALYARDLDHSPILCERLDGCQRRAFDHTLPVGSQLVLVQGRPFHDMPKRPSRQSAI